MLKTKDKNANKYKQKVTTINGYCGAVYEENLKQFRKELEKKRWIYSWNCNNKVDSNISRESRE